MSSLAAVIFDLDGVIVKTDEYHYRAWKRLADELDIPFDREKNQQLRGVGRMSSLKIVLPHDHGYSQEQLEELASRKNGYYQKLIEELSPDDLLPGTKELLDELDAHGVKKAVGSASKNAGTVVDKLQVRDRFDAVITGHDFERGKPAPDVFLAATERLGVEPGKCIVFEDAVAGVEAAHNGGMKAVGVGPKDLLSDAERVVKSLAEVSYPDLEALME